MTVGVESIILCCPMRYALGRSTYAVQEVCDAIDQHAHRLAPEQRERMAQEMETELGYADGMHMDERSWRQAVAYLRQAKGGSS